MRARGELRECNRLINLRDSFLGHRYSTAQDVPFNAKQQRTCPCFYRPGRLLPRSTVTRFREFRMPDIAYSTVMTLILPLCRHLMLALEFEATKTQVRTRTHSVLGPLLVLGNFQSAATSHRDLPVVPLLVFRATSH